LAEELAPERGWSIKQAVGRAAGTSTRACAVEKIVPSCVAMLVDCMVDNVGSRDLVTKVIEAILPSIGPIAIKTALSKLLCRTERNRTSLRSLKVMVFPVRIRVPYLTRIIHEAEFR
jgi:hypothetical protein